MGQVTFEEESEKRVPRKKEATGIPELSKITGFLVERGFVRNVKEANIALIGITLIAIILVGLILRNNRPPAYNHVQNIPPDQI